MHLVVIMMMLPLIAVTMIRLHPSVSSNDTNRMECCEEADSENFQKFGKSMKSVLGDDEIEDYHHTFLVGNKILLFSRTYRAQPTYSYGHRVTYMGGYALNFDLATKKWSEKLTFDALADDENLEEMLFTLNGQIYIVLFRTFGGIEFVKCWLWDIEGGKWLPVRLSVDENNNRKSEESSVMCKMFPIDQDSTQKDSVFFASSVDASLALHKFSVNGNKAVIEKPRILPDIYGYDSLRKPVMGARWKNSIFIMGGVHGCGFRFEPSSVLRCDYNTHETNTIKIEGEKPPFCFAGSKKTIMLPSGHWVHATGSVARGITSSRFCGEIWELDLNTEPLSWHKSAVQVPSTLNREELCVAISDDRNIYAFDRCSDLISNHF